MVSSSNRGWGARGLGDGELQRAARAVASSSSNTWPRNSLRRSRTDVQHVVGKAGNRRMELAAWEALGAHGHAAYAELATWAARGALSQHGARGIVNGEYSGVLLPPLARRWRARDSRPTWSFQLACCCCCSGHVLLLAVDGG